MSGTFEQPTPWSTQRTTYAGSADLLREIVFRMVMKLAVIFEFKAELGQFLNDYYRIETATYRAIIRLHMATCVINNSVDTTGFQRLEYGPVEMSPPLIVEVV